MSREEYRQGSAHMLMSCNELNREFGLPWVARGDSLIEVVLGTSRKVFNLSD